MGIDVTLWRIRIGQYCSRSSLARSHCSRQQRVRVATNVCLPVAIAFCLVMIPSLLIMAGDVELNPGPLQGQTQSDCAKGATPHARAASAKPTSVYCSMSCNVTIGTFRQYLSHALPKMKDYTIKKVTDYFPTSKEIEIQFSSVNQAKKAVKILQQSQTNYSIALRRQLRSHDVFKQEMEDFKYSVERKMKECLEKHGKKKEDFQRKIDALQPRKKYCPLDQFTKLKEERSVVEEQKRECELQELEFTKFCSNLTAKMDHFLASMGITRKCLQSTIAASRKEFGRECSRLLQGLPIYARRSDILETIAHNQVTVLVGETGSGKSTQIIQYLLEAGFAEKGLIVCTQPRKVAALSLAKHVSSEMGVRLGTLLGHKVGIRGKCSAETKTFYMTDHTLLNECIADHEFGKYSCIIIDEAHERSLQTDLLLALIKQCLSRRKDLKVLITSATINPDLFVKYFGQCPVIHVSGRAFPVDIIWKEPQDVSPDASDYVLEAVSKVNEIHRTKEREGGILVFLTSPVEIDRACEIVSGELSPNSAVVLPLHGRLQPDEQQKVFLDFSGKRKIVFATNVAETSVTIPGIKYVVDTGFAKELHFDPKRNMTSLQVQPISKSSANQRKGRAGRTSSGECYRLYTEEQYLLSKEQTLPEILRIHLTQAVLKLYEFGIPNILDFDFVEQPDPAALRKAAEDLVFLGAVKEGLMTESGKRMACLPIGPHFGKIILDGCEAHIGLEATVMAACSSIAGSVHFRGGTDEMKAESDLKKIRFCHEAGDQMTSLHVYWEWASQTKEQRNQWCKDNSINAKSMRIVEETVKEFREILMRQCDIKLPARVSGLENAVELLPKIIYQAFASNTSVFLGHQRIGYMSPSVPDEPHKIFPGSSICQLNQEPTYVTYEKTLKTSQHFLLQVLPVKKEWVEEAISCGKLAQDPCVQFSSCMVSPVTVSHIGKTVLRTAAGRIKKGLSDVCSNAPCFFESDYNCGQMKGFSQNCHHPAIKSMMDQEVRTARETLAKEIYDRGVSCDTDDVRLLIGRGGSIQHVMMPYHYRTVVIKGPPDGNWICDILQLLTQCGELEFEPKPTVREKECRMYVIFRSPDDAVKAVSLDDKPASVVIEPQMGYKYGEASTSPIFTLKIEWQRRRRQNYAFINFSSDEDLAMALRSLSFAPLLVRGSYVKVRPSRNASACEMFAMNVGPHISSDELKNAVESVLPGVSVTVKLGFEKSFETTVEQLTALEHQLRLLVEEHATTGRFNINLIQPRPAYVTYRAFVNFQDPNEWQQCYNALPQKSIGEHSLSVHTILSSSIRFSCKVRPVLENSVRALAVTFKQEQISVNIFTKEDKFGNLIVNLRSDDAEQFTAVRNSFTKLLQPTRLPCQGIYQCLLTEGYQKRLAEVEKMTSTYIYQDRRAVSICIYGSPDDKQQAQILMQDEIKQHEQRGAKNYEIQLKAPEWSPGLIKHLLTQFGFNLERLLQKEGVFKATINPRRQILSVWCTEKLYQWLQEFLEQHSTPIADQPDSSMEQCCVCFTDIESSQELHIQESCGHTYHIDCVRMQVASCDTFPLMCAAEDCAHGFVMADIKILCTRANLSLRDVVEASVKFYLEVNKQTVRNCLTPDCKVIYLASEDGKRFVCCQCGIHLCTKCHVQYHDGMTCAFYQAGKHGEAEFDEWMQGDASNRKRCPQCDNPIEKNGGCNHLSCKCGAQICWVCCAYFQTMNECYGHLRSEHGGFYN